MRIRLNMGGVFNCQPDWDWRTDGMADHDLWMVCRGAGTMLSEGVEQAAGPGDCFLIPPGRAVHARHDPRRPLRVVAAHFSPVSSASDRALRALPFHCRVRDSTLMETLIARAVAAWASGDAESAPVWLLAALTEYRQSVGFRTRENMPPDYYAEKIDALCARIREAPERGHAVEALAAELHVCPDHFCRIFQRRMGVSPRDFIINARIDHAKSLLAGSSHSIGRVAELAGYDSIYYFCRHFKRRTGLTPSQFRG